MAEQTTSQKIKVRACQIICKDHPEWGTWGVTEDHGGYFDICAPRRNRILDKWEADHFWEVVER